MKNDIQERKMHMLINSKNAQYKKIEEDEHIIDLYFRKIDDLDEFILLQEYLKPSCSQIIYILKNYKHSKFLILFT